MACRVGRLDCHAHVLLYVFFASYLFEDGKAAVQENDVDTIVLSSDVVCLKYFYGVLGRGAACMTARCEPV